MTGVRVTDPSGVDHIDTVSFNYDSRNARAERRDPHDLADHEPHRIAAYRE